MTHTLQAIAWTLIHFCWQAAAVAAIYRVLSLALANRSSSTRYLAALSSLLLMLAASIVTFAWEMRPAASLPDYSMAGSFFGNGRAIHNSAVSAQNPTAAQAIDTAPSLASALPWPDLLQWIDAFWLLGVVALSLRSLGGWWLIQRLRASATVEPPKAATASFRRIANALGLRRPVLLRVSSAIAGPVTVGALRAMVLLPICAATSLSPDELEVVLAHELAHVRRADFFWNLVQTLVETLFFFHPAVWWIGGRIRHERELCCDDLALEVCPNPVVYAHALFRLEEQRSRHWQLAMALDGHQSARALRMRIARILGEPFAHSASRGPSSLAAVGGALIVLLLAAPQVLSGLKPAQASVPVPATAPAIAMNVAVQPVIPAAHLNITALSQRIAVPVLNAFLQAATASAQERTTDDREPKGNYIDQMKAAGYDVDLDKYIAMKVQNVTPEYARAMSQLGFGKLSADELIACKVQGVTPEFIAKLKQGGLEVKSVQDAISYRIFDVTPEFVAEMKAAGFEALSHDQLMAMRVQGVTPEYAKAIRQQFPSATAEDLVKTKIFNIDADFIEMAKKHGFTGLSLEKLVQLRISGVLDDESVKN
jgi:beta-lactamase regulating signal transducer with metallopeptidase domain